jgi:hypothetical protein
LAVCTRSYIEVMQFDLSPEEQTALTVHLRSAVDNDRFPLAPRLRPLKAVLPKLEQPKPASKPEIPAAPKRGKTKPRR